MIKIIKNILMVTACLAMAFLYMTAFKFAVDKYARDYSYWQEYTAIDAHKPHNYNDEELYFYSYFSRYKTIDADWQDMLRCRPWGDSSTPFARVSLFTSDAKKLGPVASGRSKWLYDERLPQKDSECYIASLITITVSKYINHTQRIDSSTFRIKPR